MTLDQNASLLREFVAPGGVLVLTGAGVSTDSGIPAYRDEQGVWRHPKPLEYREFVGSEATRQRYWARSLLGWPLMRGAQPNLAHHALAELERRGFVASVITQNVDGLHRRAGTRNVVELHGRLDQVVCLSCRRERSREWLQAALSQLNPGFRERSAPSSPDGDAQLLVEETQGFRLVDCPDCAGLLKPDVVFFGEAVPRPRVDQALSLLSRSRALLVVGSSLAVYSGFRLVRAAQRVGLRVAVLNRGSTRADPLASFRVDENAGSALSRLVDQLRSERGP